MTRAASAKRWKMETKTGTGAASIWKAMAIQVVPQSRTVEAKSRMLVMGRLLACRCYAVS